MSSGASSKFTSPTEFATFALNAKYSPRRFNSVRTSAIALWSTMRGCHSPSRPPHQNPPLDTLPCQVVPLGFGSISMHSFSASVMRLSHRNHGKMGTPIEVLVSRSAACISARFAHPALASLQVPVLCHYLLDNDLGSHFVSSPSSIAWAARWAFRHS